MLDLLNSPNGSITEGNFINGNLEGEVILTTVGKKPMRTIWSKGAILKEIGPVE